MNGKVIDVRGKRIFVEQIEKQTITRRQIIQHVAATAMVGIPVAMSMTSCLANSTTDRPADPPRPGGGDNIRNLVPVPIEQVEVKDDFWSPKYKIWRDVTIADCFTKFENDRGGAINNFDLVRDGKTGKHAGPPWYDGLIYEMIRGCADFLASERDPALEKRIDDYISRMMAAQAKDASGYLNTFTQTMLPQTQRWGQNDGDDRNQHDVYNAGMMIEAGVHYWKATGKAALLEAATRMANLMCDTIGPSPKANVVPGHSGPEEALVLLSLLYRDNPKARKAVSVPVEPERYLRLAEFFIDGRGHYEGRTDKSKNFAEYGQDHAPLDQQKTLEGHAVRAALFATGISAAAQVNKRAEYLAAANRFWDNLTLHKLYISGAAGAIENDEKLGPDYFLPNDGYMETCAAVAVGFYSRNMNLLWGEAHYIDVLERALYNAVLGGVAQAGDRYYYQNPLSGAGLRRWEWHDCPCCPPMFLKLVGALPGYIYAQDTEAVYVNLFIGSSARLTVRDTAVRLRQTTEYPWEGTVKLVVEPEKPVAFDLMVRIPVPDRAINDPADALYRTAAGSVVSVPTLTVNGKRIAMPEMVRGYARLNRTWKAGDVVELRMEMPVRQVKAHPLVEADRGLVALMRGPILYCLEGVDNPDGIGHLVVPEEASFTTAFQKDLLDGVTVVKGKGLAIVTKGGKRQTKPATFTAIPFYASANRAAGALRVWLPATEDKAVPSTLATRSKASASHCWHLDSVAAINDGVVPQRSDDTSKSRLSWWDHKGTSEWAELVFPEPTKVSKVRVFWFADRPANGGCALPQSWRLVCKDGDTWKPVEGASAYGLAPDKFNEVTFTPVQTTALRIELQLQPGWSAGIFEWEVE